MMSRKGAARMTLIALTLLLCGAERSGTSAPGAAEPKAQGNTEQAPPRP